MENVICKQERAFKGKIVSVIVLAFSICYLFAFSESIFSRALLFAISLLIFGFSISYKINSDFNNEKFFSFFGVTIFKTKLKINYPEYISVFSSSFSSDNEWSSVAALGTKERQDKVVVRFFNGSERFTVYSAQDYQDAVVIANRLSKILRVDIYDASKE